MSSIRELNTQFQLGQLPDALNYAPKVYCEISIDKLRYNSYYKSPEFFLNKFENPTALLNLPGGIDIIQSLIENSKTPLEEILELQQKEISIELIENGLDE